MKYSKEQKLTFAHIFIFFLLTIIAYRKVFFGDGVIGHNWDWIIPYFPEQLVELSKYGKYLWYEYALGTSASIAQTSSVVYLLTWIVGKLGFSGVFFTKLVLFHASFLSSVAFYFLIRFFVRSAFNNEKYEHIYWAAFFGGLYYGFSPYLFNELNGGATSKIFSYPLVPLFVLFGLKYIKEKGYFSFNWFFSSVSLLLVASAFQNLVLASVFFSLFVLYFAILQKSIVPIIKAGLIYISFVLLSAFWIFPLISTLNYAVTEFVKKELFSESALVFNIPQWYEILVGAGYFREFFTLSSATFLRPYLFVFGFSLLALVVYSLYLARFKNKQLFFTLCFFCSYYIFSIIPAVSGRAPFGQYVIYLYKHIGLLNLFRSPQHFIFQVTLAFGMLIALGFYVIYSSLEITKKKHFILGTSVVFLVFLNGFLLRGDLASDHFKTFRSAGNYVDYFKYPESYRTLFNKIASDKTSTNTAFFPSGYSPYYMKNEYQHYGQGGDPFMLSFPHPYVANTSIRSQSGLQLIEKLEDQINTVGLNNDTYRYLSMLGVKDIILRNDVIVNFGNFSLLDTYDFLKSQFDAQLTPEQFDYLSLYRIEPSPRIYAVDRYKTLANNFDDTLNYEKVLRLTDDNSVLVQEFNKTGDYVIPPITNQDDVFFEIVTSGNYIAEVLQEDYFSQNSQVSIKQASCETHDQVGSFIQNIILSELTTKGVFLEKGCYIANQGNINKKPFYTGSLLTTKKVPSLNLKHEISLIEFPFDQKIHNYHISFKHDFPIRSEEIFIWVKICGDPKTYVINTTSETCIYDLVPIRQLGDDIIFKGFFNISGNRIYSAKGLGFKFGDEVKLENLELKEIRNPIVAFRNSSIASKIEQNFIPVEFAKINPTKYLITVPEIQKDKFLLYFGQNFDDGWVLKQATDIYSFDGSLYDYDKFNTTEKTATCSNCFWPITSSTVFGKHVKANVFANGWLLDPASDSYSNQMILEFRPHQFYVLGLYISAVVILVFIAIIVIGRRLKTEV